MYIYTFKVYLGNIKYRFIMTYVHTTDKQVDVFKDEHIVFDGFKDRKLKNFIESKGGTASYSSGNSSFNINATMIVYADASDFKKSLTYQTAKGFDVSCLSKSKFFTKYEINIDSDVPNNTEITELTELIDDMDLEIDVADIKNICRLLNKNLPDFYDDIYIPYDLFKEGEWDINDILHKNADVLFYNKKCMTTDDDKRFYEVFDKYICLMEPIWEPDSQLRKYLKSWAKKSGVTYLKYIMTKDKYKIISPMFLADTYKKMYIKCDGGTELLKVEYIKCLDKIMSVYENEIHLFKIEIDKIINAYVYEYPIECISEKEKVQPIDSLNYTKGFINSIILAIIEFAEKLITLNIYAIHTIVVDVINYYVPLDDINLYKRDEHSGKKLITI